MKLPKIYAAALVAALGALAIFFFLAKKQTPPAGSLPRLPDAAYASYVGAGFLPVRFDYPKDWRAQEDKGKIDVYSQVIVLGPRNVDDTYTATFIVRGAPLKAAGGRFGSLEEIYEHHKKHLAGDPKVIHEGVLKLAGVDAKELTAAYTIPKMFQRGLKAKEVPVRTTSVFLQKGRRLYELVYSADRSDFEKNNPHFQRLLRSFSAEV